MPIIIIILCLIFLGLQRGYDSIKREAKYQRGCDILYKNRPQDDPRNNNGVRPIRWTEPRKSWIDPYK